MAASEMPEWLKRVVAPIVVLVAVAGIVNQFSSILEGKTGPLVIYIALAVIAFGWAVHVWTTREPSDLDAAVSRLKFPSHIRWISTIAFLVLASLAVIRALPPAPLFKIEAFYGGGMSVSPEAIVQLTELYRGTGISLSLQRVHGLIPKVVDAEFRKKALSRDLTPGLPGHAGPTVTIWVVSEQLSGSGGGNLLATSLAKGAFITTFGTTQSEATLNDPIVMNYVAVSMALRALQVLVKPHSVLPERNYAAETGCFFDYHPTRQTFVMMSQAPYLCDREGERLRKLLRERPVDAVEKLFANIRGPSDD